MWNTLYCLECGTHCISMPTGYGFSVHQALFDIDLYSGSSSGVLPALVLLLLLLLIHSLPWVATKPIGMCLAGSDIQTVS